MFDNQLVLNKNQRGEMFCGQEVLLYGAAVCRFGSGLDEAVLEALSWVFLNRRAASPAVDRALQPEGASPDWVEKVLSDPLSTEGVRGLAVMSRVLTGAVPDPTGGATRFHCHNEAPSWAAAMEIRAVIGPYLFYAPAPNGRN